MKVLLSLLSFILIPTFGFAAQPPGCWTSEVSPVSKKIYSQTQWEQDLAQWLRLEPESPSLWSLFKAHQTYKKEQAAVKKIKGDKRKHCYIGCRIAQENSLEVSLYVGWLKESEDLQDCDKKTYFEPLDHQSTVDGAVVGSESQSPKICHEFCSAYKPSERLY
jgi:hypothetical protein